ncbi:MAG: hypothetical protein LH654_02370, partial [Thermoleophilia bacterium]|nr:hypothetical protein [Thermoleophilia bacterium]
LVDTAVVGHLGRSQLAALGHAAPVLSVLAMFNFLQYGPPAQVARATGAGKDLIAARLGAQCLWLSLAFGVVVAIAVAVLASPVVDAIGVEGQTAEYAVTYLRIAAIGIPSAFLAIGGQGFLRGVSDLRTPLVIIIAGNVVNLVLELVLVYGFDLALLASFFLAGVVVARLGDAPLAAHQVAFQLWILLALILDAIAIAGQIIMGQELGATRSDAAFAASVRMIGLSIAVGTGFALVFLGLGDVIPRIFTSDPDVLAQCALLGPLFALMQPLNGAVFALDGILIGASDGAYLALSMVAAFVVFVCALAAVSWADWGVRGVWAALTVLIATRLLLMSARFLRRQWLVTGFE